MAVTTARQASASRPLQPPGTWHGHAVHRHSALTAYCADALRHDRMRGTDKVPVATLEASRVRLRCLVELVPHLRGKLQKSAADDAWGIAMEREDGSAASTLARYVSAERLPPTLAELAFAMPWAQQLIRLIAARLTRDQLHAAMARTNELPNSLDYLSSLVPRLDDAERTEVLRLARAAVGPEQRFPVMLPFLPFMDTATTRETIAERFATVRDQSRAEVLATCAETNVIAMFSDQAIARIANHIIEICHKWSLP
jgi:hypothetical protein